MRTVVLALLFSVAMLGCQKKAAKPAPKDERVSRQELHDWSDKIQKRVDAITKSMEAGTTNDWSLTRLRVFNSEQEELNGYLKQIAKDSRARLEVYPSSTRKLMVKAEQQLDTLEFMLGLSQ